MTSLRDRLLTFLTEVSEAEKAATAAPWRVTPERGVHATDGRYVLHDSRLTALDADFIALSRSVVGPFAEGLADEVRRYHWYTNEEADEQPIYRCAECDDAPVFDADDDCPFIRRWASRLGITEETS